MNEDKEILVLYHGGCPDGFGSAYAAWKKFGDTATYIPLSRDDAPDYERVTNKEVYFLDFCYDTQEEMDMFVQKAKRLVMLDHHLSVKEIVESIPEHQYGTDQSGAVLAWNYFNPDKTLPKLLSHIQDSDLYLFTLPDTRAVITYLEMTPFDFETWDTLARDMDTPEIFPKLLERMQAYAEYFEHLSSLLVSKAKLVSFEGYECYFSSSIPLQSLRSKTGNTLCRQKGPVSLLVASTPKGYAVTIYGDGSVDVSEIAKKFGGGGHKNASGFFINREGPFPWTRIEENETPSN